MKQAFIIFSKLIISILLLWFLTHTSKLNFSLLLNLRHSPTLFFETLIIYLIIVALSARRWQLLNNKQAIQLSYWHTLIPTYLGIAFNNLLPGGVGGDFFRFYYLNKKTNSKKSRVMLSILFDRVLGLTGIFITVIFISVLNLRTSNHQSLILYLCLSSLLFCSVILMVFLISGFISKKYLSRRAINQSKPNKLVSTILSVLDAMDTYKESKQIIIKSLIYSIIIQILIAITCMLIARMLYFPYISFNHYIYSLAVTQLANLIPIAPGGIGVGEAAFANMLQLLDKNTVGTYATIFLAYRIIGILIYLPALAILFLDRQNLKVKSLSIQTEAR